jgi:hypothetical protein
VPAVVLAADGESVADWVAAIGQVAGALFTAAAVAVALWLAVRESRWRRADQAERDAERIDREAAQARLIAVEATYDYFSKLAKVEYAVKVLNGSSLPIFDVKIADVRNDDIPDLGWRIDPLGYLDGQPIEARVLPAGGSFGLPIGFVDTLGRAAYPDGEDHVTVEFTDAAGLRWRRRNNEPPERAISTTPGP